jgi:hypothetical protein
MIMSKVLNAIVHANREIDSRDLLDICGGWLPEWIGKEFENVWVHRWVYLNAGPHGLHNIDLLDQTAKPWSGCESKSEYVHMVAIEADDLPPIEGTLIVYDIDEYAMEDIYSSVHLFGKPHSTYKANRGFCLRYLNQLSQFSDPTPIKNL